jgi:hypothetical protein
LTSKPGTSVTLATQQWLGTTGQLGLLLRQAQGRLDIDHQIFVARAREALNQVLDLRALQGHFGEPRFRQRLTGRGFPRQLLCLPGQRARFDRIAAGLLALSRQLFLDGRKLLPEHGTGHQSQRGDSQKKIHRAARHHHTLRPRNRRLALRTGVGQCGDLAFDGRRRTRRL